MDWIDISIFISSTFNDMHAERDLLLKKVFPELSDWCARRRIRLYDIDLRWGVTSEDSRSKNTVEVCLRNIDLCRPFFLCFLGQRRGWVPGMERINPDTLVHYPGITERIGKRSVTEMEIEHALLAPMLRLVDGKKQLPSAAANSLFFLRDGSYLSSLNEAQRLIFTNADTEDETQTNAEHAAFLSRVRREWNEVYNYTCRFDPSLYSSELQERGEDCASGRLTDFVVQSQPMDRFILEALKGQILSAYPERAQEIPENEDEPEEDYQERWGEAARRGTIDREELSVRLAQYCARNENKTIFVYGGAGCGKTTLLSRFFHEQQQDYDRSILRFCSISAGSFRWSDLWQGILKELEIKEHFESGSQEGLLKTLRKISDKGKTLIVIDAVDELQEGISVLSSIPELLPEGLRLIVSFRSDATDATALLEYLKSVDTARLCEVSPLSGEQEIISLSHSYLEQYLKALDDEQIQIICENPAATNPLFLKILLRELRVFGSRSQIVRQLAAYGDTPQSAFGKLLIDLENEISYNLIPSETFVPQMMGTLSRVRGRIRLHVFKQALSLLLEESEERVSDTLAFYIRRLRPYLSTDGNQIGISYRSLQESALQRYTDSSTLQHEALAVACYESEPLESLYHYRMSGNWESVFHLSGELSFLLCVIRQSGAVSLLAEMEACFANNRAGVQSEVLECLRQTAVLMGKNTQLAAPIFYKELEDPALRQQAKALCEKPWLRYEPVRIEPPAETEPQSFQALFSVEHMGCQGFCLAENKNLAFLLRGEADVSVCDLNTGMEGATFSLSGHGRLRKIVCSPDGSILAVVAEDLSLYLYRTVLDSSLRLMALNLILTDCCASVRFGGVSLFSGSDGIIWQRPDGTPVRWLIESGKLEEQPVESKRLTACFAGGTVWKDGSTYQTRIAGGQQSFPFSARINAALLYDGFLYLAAENRALTVVCPETGEEVEALPLPAESLICLCEADGKIYGADRYGTLVLMKDRQVELLGRITQGDAVIDTNTQLLPISSGKIAFVSLQRRVVLSTETSRRTMRLFHVYPTAEGCALLWDGAAEFVAEFPDGRRRFVPYPKKMLAGNTLNEKNNLRAACSERALLYEENGYGLHCLTPERDIDLPAAGVSEMGGFYCELRYVPETESFQGTSYEAQFWEITEQGEVLARLNLPRSDSNLYTLCPCGERSAVLSRRVRIRADAAASATIIDVLTMIEKGNVLWTLELPRGDDQVRGLLYDRRENRLVLFFSTDRMEVLETQTGRIVGKNHFPLVNFVPGAAVRGKILFSVNGSGRESLLTARALSGDWDISLPSHRRVKQIIEGISEVFVQEGDEKLYRVSVETGDEAKESF